MKPLTTTAAVALLAGCAMPASATLLSADHPQFGQHTLTLDTAQGLYWLTPTVTAGLSFVETQALLSADPRFAGFRVATQAELEKLYLAAGIPDVNVPGYGALYGTEANVQGVQYLQGFTGATYALTVAGVDLAETAGFIGEPFVSPINGYLSVVIGNIVVRTNVQTQSGITSFASAYTDWGSLPVGMNAVGVGTWLVSAVPEPTTLFAMLAGLGTVGAWCRRTPPRVPDSPVTI